MSSSSGAPDAIVVTSAYGSRGDFAPLLAIARACRAAAPATTRVAFLSNPHYAAEVEATAPGVAFAGVGSARAHAELLADASRRRDPRALARYWLSHLDEHIDVLLRELEGAARAVVVAHPLVRSRYIKKNTPLTSPPPPAPPRTPREPSPHAPLPPPPPQKDLAARCLEEWHAAGAHSPAAAATRSAEASPSRPPRRLPASLVVLTALLSPALLRTSETFAPPVGVPALPPRLRACLPVSATRAWASLGDALVDRMFRPTIDAFFRARRIPKRREGGGGGGGVLLRDGGEGPSRERHTTRPSSSFATSSPGVFREWFLARGGVLCMWPEWFAPPDAEWPSANATLCGFPTETDPDEPATNAKPTSLDPELSAFLRDHPRPFVFVAGTGNPPHARAFFRAAVAAIERVRRRGSNANASASVFFESERKNAATTATAATPSAPSTHSLPECLTSRASALLLTRHPETALSACPTPLPPHVLALPWADLRRILPNCACLVHNAGVGSVALALELGAAQVLAPAGFDQPENAERARALVDAPVVPMRVFADAGRVEDVADALEFAARTRRAMDAMEAMREGGHCAMEERRRSRRPRVRRRRTRREVPRRPWTRGVPRRGVLRSSAAARSPGSRRFSVSLASDARWRGGSNDVPGHRATTRERSRRRESRCASPREPRRSAAPRGLPGRAAPPPSRRARAFNEKRMESTSRLL